MMTTITTVWIGVQSRILVSVRACNTLPLINYLNCYHLFSPSAEAETQQMFFASEAAASTLSASHECEIIPLTSKALDPAHSALKVLLLLFLASLQWSLRFRPIRFRPNRMQVYHLKSSRAHQARFRMKELSSFQNPHLPAKVRSLLIYCY